MTAQELKSIIETALSDTTAIIDTHDNVHFDAIILSPAFKDIKSKVKQQQMVYQAINQHIASGEVHAISMKTYTPEQWQNIQSNT